MLLSRMPSGDPEVFATVQGEGASMGVSSVFVRLAECNLRCSWCDTSYTWDWKRHDRASETVEISAADVVALVTAKGPKNVVLTGGEPLLQQDELATLTKELEARGFRIEIETNGTIVPSAALAEHVDQWNVSPKLASSGNPEKARLRPAPLGWFASRDNAFFKLVVTSPDDLAEVEQIASAFELPRTRVILMPEGVDATTLAERSRWLADHCAKSGYRLGARLHVFLWGAKRGV